MKIGVLSDTHGILPAAVFRAFDGVDRIIHCGDVGSPEILIELAAQAPVEAVHGNTDPFSVCAVAPERRTFKVQDVTIAVTHGHQTVYPDRRLKKLAELFALARPQIICYGHSHLYAEDHLAGILFLNPGSVRAPRGGNKPTVAIITIDEERINIQRIELG